VHSPPPHQRSHALDDVRVHSPNQHVHNIDPAIAGSSMMSNSAGESGGDDNGSDGKKGGKRELSTSKRAAQNRAAQVRLRRFFRISCDGEQKITMFPTNFRASFPGSNDKDNQLTNT